MVSLDSKIRCENILVDKAAENVNLKKVVNLHLTIANAFVD